MHRFITYFNNGITEYWEAVGDIVEILAGYMMLTDYSTMIVTDANTGEVIAVFH